MGCFYSREEDREEIVWRCKARTRYMKGLVDARQSFSTSHAMYLRSLRATGSALLQFAEGENHLIHHHYQKQNQHQHLQNISLPLSPLPSLPPQVPPLSPSSDSWSSTTASHALPPPPPPPFPNWYFWNPFAPLPATSQEEEECEAATIATTSVSETTISTIKPRSRSKAIDSVAPPSEISIASCCPKNTSSELAMIPSKNCKDLVQIIKELDDYFLKASVAGHHVSMLLQSPITPYPTKRTKKINGKSLIPSSFPWQWGSKYLSCNRYGKFNDVKRCPVVGGNIDLGMRHSSTIDQLYVWEKKLYSEVKNAEMMKIEHERRVLLLQKQEAKGADYIKVEKNRKEVRRLESGMVVVSQVTETISREITRLRDMELYPQLLELVKGLTGMWRSMYECHQVQSHIVQQLTYIRNFELGMQPTSPNLHQSVLQLEFEVQQWHLAFSYLMKSQKDYIHSLTSWLKLCPSQFDNFTINKTPQECAIYDLCVEWQLALDKIPHNVASDGIKSLLTVVNSVSIQQAEELSNRHRSQVASKMFEKNLGSLRSLELKYGSSITQDSIHQLSISKKRAKTEVLRAMAEDKKTVYEKSIIVTRSLTLNNLQMEFPIVFQAMTGFSRASMQAFESIYNISKRSDQIHDLRRLLE